MELKRALVLNVMLLTLLMTSLLATAWRPIVGLPFLEERGARSGLVCCNNCNCNPEEASCTCDDNMAGYCADGCDDCDCGDAEGYCQCRDMLEACPDLCDSDYVVDKAPAESNGKADDDETSN